MSEEWLPVPGYEMTYQVSSLGRVARLSKRGERLRILSVSDDGRGYRRVQLWQHNAGTTWKVHRLVLLAFKGPRPNGYEVRHLDGDRNNNALANLTYGTSSENNYDKRRHGSDHNARKTHCSQGHPYNAQNTRLYKGRRYCRACDVLRGKGNPDRDWTRCPQGHLFDEENTYRDKRGKRSCRECARERSRQRYRLNASR